MSKTNRRDFLINYTPLMTAGLLLPGLAGGVIAGSSDHRANIVSPPPSFVDSQAEWRWCEKCYSLFWFGYYPNKGRCSAGGGHSCSCAVTGTSNYFLPYGNLPEIGNAQINWRFCDKCFVMFFDGYPAKGRCAAGGGHNAQGFKFRIPHDIGADANNQAGWRFCTKCSAMFWDEYPGKGNCPGGGGHAAAGYKFVLPLAATDPTSPPAHAHADVYTDGWAPIGGWVDLTAKSNGDYVFSGHVHNSGGLNIRFTLGAVMISPIGYKFGFANSGKRVDGTETVFGRNRDCNWNQPGNDQTIARNFSEFSKSTLHWQLSASAAVLEGPRRFLESIVIKAYNVLPAGGQKEFWIGKPLNLILTL